MHFLNNLLTSLNVQTFPLSLPCYKVIHMLTYSVIHYLTPLQDRRLLVSPDSVGDCTFGHNEHASTLQQISWEVSLDAISFGLKIAEKRGVQNSVCQSGSHQFYPYLSDHWTGINQKSNHITMKISYLCRYISYFLPQSSRNHAYSCVPGCGKNSFSIRDHNKASFFSKTKQFKTILDLVVLHLS